MSIWNFFFWNRRQAKATDRTITSPPIKKPIPPAFFFVRGEERRSKSDTTESDEYRRLTKAFFLLLCKKFNSARASQLQLKTGNLICHSLIIPSRRRNTPITFLLWIFLLHPPPLCQTQQNPCELANAGRGISGGDRSRQWWFPPRVVR